MYQEDKTTQMAACFLTLAGGRLTCTDLMGLLYAADRQMLVRHGAPITYDAWLSAENGPILGATLDLIRSSSALSTYWANHITVSGDIVYLVSDPGDDALSPAEDAVIEKTFRNWEANPQPLKSQFPEWSSSSGPPVPISYAEVLQMNSFSQDEAAEIVAGNEVQDVPYQLGIAA